LYFLHESHSDEHKNIVPEETIERNTGEHINAALRDGGVHHNFGLSGKTRNYLVLSQRRGGAHLFVIPF
jgi:hypothetical protein